MEIRLARANRSYFDDLQDEANYIHFCIVRVVLLWSIFVVIIITRNIYYHTFEVFVKKSHVNFAPLLYLSRQPWTRIWNKKWKAFIETDRHQSQAMRLFSIVMAFIAGSGSHRMSRSTPTGLKTLSSASSFRNHNFLHACMSWIHSLNKPTPASLKVFHPEHCQGYIAPAKV